MVRLFYKKQKTLNVNFSAKRGNNTEAIRLFAEQICFASALGGTESIGSASGYFNIAQAIGDTHAKCSLFNKGKRAVVSQ